jgi:hypothetical protein
MLLVGNDEYNSFVVVVESAQGRYIPKAQGFLVADDIQAVVSPPSKTRQWVYR